MTDLELVVARAIQYWPLVQTESDEWEVYIDSVALDLHGFYSGVERLLELIARRVDQHVPEGANWHRDLLIQMGQDVLDARPAVISEETAVATPTFSSTWFVHSWQCHPLLFRTGGTTLSLWLWHSLSNRSFRCCNG